MATESEEKACSLRAAINDQTERLSEIESEALDTWSDSGMRRLRTESDAIKAQIRDLEKELSAIEDAEVFAESAWGPTAEQLKEMK